MSIYAMTVVSIDAHPNADALRVVACEAPSRPRVTIVANMQEPFEVGDTVTAATVGAVLADGTKIRKARLRGIDSFGMILGRVDAPPGTDLTERFGAPIANRSGAPPGAGEPGPDTPSVLDVPDVPMVKWASIEGLPHVRKTVAAHARLDPTAIVQPTVTYRAKVKLDGTNAGVQILDGGRFVAQSRTRLLSPQSDNYGFAAWVHEHGDYFRGLFELMGRAIVYGEWCGPGIQKRVAINKIERRLFAVFAIVLGDPERESTRILFEPEQIAALLPEHPDVAVLPWHGDPVALDFHDEAGLQPGVEQLNAMVERVEAIDPWVHEQFGIEGHGEGVVLYPVDPVQTDERGAADRDTYCALMFKAKGEAHRVNRHKQAVALSPQVAADIAAFVDTFVTPARLDQGVTEACEGEYEMRRMGDFLRWLGRDVKKESVLELEASQLEWKKVAKAVAQAGQRWYRRKVAEA